MVSERTVIRETAVIDAVRRVLADLIKRRQIDFCGWKWFRQDIGKGIGKEGKEADRVIGWLFSLKNNGMFTILRQ